MLHLLTLTLWSAAAFAESPAGGMMEAITAQGEVSALPMLKSDVTVRISGDLATVSLIQTFHNPNEGDLSARYLFPLPDDAAVYSMLYKVGDLVVEGQIRERHVAQAEFDQAKAEGKQAALLTQHKPNVFTQDIANLPGGETVQVEIRYAQPVPMLDGAYTWHFPMVVGPRYQPGDAGSLPGAAPALSQWTVAASTEVTLPETIDADRVRLRVLLDGGAPVSGIQSPSHPVVITEDGAQHRTVNLASDRTLDNKDFVLTYRLGGEQLAAAVNTNGDGGEGVVSLLLSPPTSIPAERQIPRELVFVLDTSCSMSGAPMDTSRLFMEEALKTLGKDDSFRLLNFSSSVGALSDEPLRATPENLKLAHKHLQRLDAGGGTDMRLGIEAALGQEAEPGVMRIVVFLTDGYIGNEGDIIPLVERLRGDARLFSLGVGSSVNRWLLEELARAGRGVARIVLDDDAAKDAARALAQRIAAPALTDLQIVWGDAPVEQVSPARLPDLFMGQPVRVLARYTRGGRYPVILRGRQGDEIVELRVDLVLPERSDGGAALPTLWARSLIQDRMIDYLSPFADPTRRQALEQEITSLGLEHHLITQWTSFVAVAHEAQLAQRGGPTLNVVTPTPHGVSSYGGGGGFSGVGGATPEPATGLALTLLAAGAAWVGRKRAQA
ncbi:MAG: VWA domain-containing protein [Deltaproteobacteria bacterium]|nr:VWA domain-containing protein [Deltaproteobacteria bacterium]